MSVIVLNNNYMFLNKVSLKKALLYITKGKVTIEKCNGKVTRSFSGEIPTPLVVRLVYVIKSIYKRAVIWTKRNVMIRDGFECVYCGHKKTLTIDHVFPKSKGGKNSFVNTVTACKECNSAKGDKTIEEANMYFKERGYKPYKPTVYEFIEKYHESLDINNLLEELEVY